MKQWVASKLVCPRCVEGQLPLGLTVTKAVKDDIVDGELACRECGARYPIRQGVAVVVPDPPRAVINDDKGYNAPGMMSAYLWSHYADLLDEPRAPDAYERWASCVTASDGDALDVGCAVGRLSFELTRTHRRVIGIDNSYAFIRKARDIMQQKRLEFELIIEGHLTEPRGCDLRDAWDMGAIDFIVADALALPFRNTDFATVSAVNLLEKVPDPLQHLKEVDRVLRRRSATFLFSDPFSWDAAFSAPDRWLGGNGGSRFCDRGIDTMRRLFAGEFDVFDPPLAVTGSGDIAWTIRKTEHLWEQITSQYLIGKRE